MKEFDLEEGEIESDGSYSSKNCNKTAEMKFLNQTTANNRLNLSQHEIGDKSDFSNVDCFGAEFDSNRPIRRKRKQSSKIFKFQEPNNNEGQNVGEYDEDADNMDTILVRGATPPKVFDLRKYKIPLLRKSVQDYSNATEGPISEYETDTKNHRKKRRGNKGSKVKDGEYVKKFEICKFYLSGGCLQQDRCLFMHSDFPCKYYYLGLNSKLCEPCKFSHGGPLSYELKEALKKHITLAPKQVLGDFPRLDSEAIMKMIDDREVDWRMENGREKFNTTRSDSVERGGRFTFQSSLSDENLEKSEMKFQGNSNGLGSNPNGSFYESRNNNAENFGSDVQTNWKILENKSKNPKLQEIMFGKWDDVEVTPNEAGGFKKSQKDDDVENWDDSENELVMPNGNILANIFSDLNPEDQKAECEEIGVPNEEKIGENSFEDSAVKVFGKCNGWQSPPNHVENYYRSRENSVENFDRGPQDDFSGKENMKKNFFEESNEVQLTRIEPEIISTSCKDDVDNWDDSEDELVKPKMKIEETITEKSDSKALSPQIEKPFFRTSRESSVASREGSMDNLNMRKMENRRTFSGKFNDFQSSSIYHKSRGGREDSVESFHSDFRRNFPDKKSENPRWKVKEKIYGKWSEIPSSPMEHFQKSRENSVESCRSNYQNPFRNDCEMLKAKIKENKWRGFKSSPKDSFSNSRESSVERLRPGFKNGFSENYPGKLKMRGKIDGYLDEFHSSPNETFKYSRENSLEKSRPEFQRNFSENNSGEPVMKEKRFEKWNNRERSPMEIEITTRPSKDDDVENWDDSEDELVKPKKKILANIHETPHQQIPDREIPPTETHDGRKLFVSGDTWENREKFISNSENSKMNPPNGSRESMTDSSKLYTRRNSISPTKPAKHLNKTNSHSAKIAECFDFLTAEQLEKLHYMGICNLSDIQTLTIYQMNELQLSVDQISILQNHALKLMAMAVKPNERWKTQEAINVKRSSTQISRNSPQISTSSDEEAPLIIDESNVFHSSRESRTRNQYQEPLQMPMKYKFEGCACRNLPKVPQNTEVCSNLAKPEDANFIGDSVLQRRFDNNLNNRTPPKEIKCSINSHFPYVYQLFEIDLPPVRGLKYIDATQGVDNFDKSPDPRFKIINLPTSATNKSENPLRESIFAHQATDPRCKKDDTCQPQITRNQNQLRPNLLSTNSILYPYLQKSTWYQNLNSTIKIQVNEILAQLSKQLNEFHENSRNSIEKKKFSVALVSSKGTFSIVEILMHLQLHVSIKGEIIDQSIAARIPQSPRNLGVSKFKAIPPGGNRPNFAVNNSQNGRPLAKDYNVRQGIAPSGMDSYQSAMIRTTPKKSSPPIPAPKKDSSGSEHWDSDE